MVGRLFPIYWKTTPSSFLTGKRGKKSTVKFLLSKGANCKLRDEDGHTPLMSYIMTGECSISMIQVLLNAGSDVNAQNSVGASVLQLAAKYCESKIVKHLLINGANAKLADGKGTTALMSCIGKPTKIMKLLVVSGGVELLNAKNSEGRTALHLAAMKNDEHALLVLLSEGANISVRDEDGMTALSLASSAECQAILQKAASVVSVQKTGVKK
jgi:ankyrin repeat protein